MNRIDAAVPGDRKVIKNEAEKMLKYKDPVPKIQFAWIMRAKVVPVKTGVSGTISQSLKQYLSNILGKYEITKLKKKKSHIGHSTRTEESADIKVQNIFQGRNNITCSTNCKYRTVATLYTQQT
jgi:hypothetical protein